MPGQFSVRGGIIDIYSLTEENPWRIELWGDEIVLIISFDAESQRSLENLDEYYYLSCSGKKSGKKKWYLFWRYFSREKKHTFS